MGDLQLHYRLSEYSLEENLHYKSGIGEYGLNDLSLLPDGCTNFREEVREAGFALRCWSIRIR